MQTETRRQIEHMVPVTFALLLRWLPLWAALTLAGLAVIYGGLISQHIFRKTLRDDEKRLGFSPGKLIYGAAVFVLLLIFREPMYYVVGGAWALMGIGDGMSNIVGRRYGRVKVPWNRAKTFEGAAAFVAFGGLAAGCVIWWIGLGKYCPDYSLGYAMRVAFIAAVAAALVETVRVPHVDDNITVPAVGAAVLYALTAPWSMTSGASIASALVLNVLLALAAWRAGAVDRSGFVVGLVIGAAVAVSLGLPGFALLALMFLLGSGATRWGYTRKKAAGTAQESGGRRGWVHALANCIVPALCAALAALEARPGPMLWQIAFAASLATAAMDTVSTELGSLYGETAVLLPTFRRVKPGTEGAVSVEGTVLGLLAAALVALAAFGVSLIAASACWMVLVGALLGTTVESLIGAFGVGRSVAANTALNITNTAVGAAVAMLLGAYLA